MKAWAGVAMLQPKFQENVGGLFRSAHAFGVDALFVIGARYSRNRADTSNATKHIPLTHVLTLRDLGGCIPSEVTVMALEVWAPSLIEDLPENPARCLYLLGPEDGSLSASDLDESGVSWIAARIGSDLCLNVATAGSIALYDRTRRVK